MHHLQQSWDGPSQVGSIPSSSPGLGQSCSPLLHPHQPHSAPQLLPTSTVSCSVCVQDKVEQQLGTGALHLLSSASVRLGRGGTSSSWGKPSQEPDYALPSSTLTGRRAPAAAGERGCPPAMPKHGRSGPRKGGKAARSGAAPGAAGAAGTAGAAGAASRRRRGAGLRRAVRGRRAPSCARRDAGPGGAPPTGSGGAAAASAACRAAPRKSKPLKAGRIRCNSARHDTPPAGHLGVPAALCPASWLAPKENSITLLYRVLAGHHPTVGIELLKGLLWKGFLI